MTLAAAWIGQYMPILLVTQAESGPAVGMAEPRWVPARSVSTT
jgi:hypothetical protein